jgi:hypothetical protein
VLAICGQKILRMITNPGFLTWKDLFRGTDPLNYFAVYLRTDYFAVCGQGDSDCLRCKIHCFSNKCLVNKCFIIINSERI